jgi:hypothetical protein
MTYEEMLAALPKRKLTDEERADWAYGNAKLSNEDVTREMAEKAVSRAPRYEIPLPSVKVYIPLPSADDLK